MSYAGTAYAVAPYAGGAVEATEPTGTLDAVLPQLTAALTGDVPREGSLTGALPALTANLDGDSVPLITEGTLDATLPGLTAVLDGSSVGAPIDATLTALLPSLTAALNGTTVAPNELAAILPALTADLAGTVQVIGRTDLLSDVSEGYNYDGESDVLDDGTTGSIPLAVRLAPIRIVHQSLPTPVLVNGRPTWSEVGD